MRLRNTTENETMIFTVLSYNIERGFHTENHVREESRLAAAQQIVQDVNPDILALTEACYGGPNSHGIQMDYQDLFGFPYGQFGGYPYFGPRRGDEGGNCLLSRFPMHAESIRLAYKGAVRGQVELDDKALCIDVVHPSYSVDDREKIATLRPLIRFRQEPYLLTGDFNTIHPDDSYDWDQVSKRLRDSFDDDTALSLVENWRKAELVSWILAQGLRDPFSPEDRQSTVPTSKEGKGNSGVRLDFFFLSPSITAKEAYVLKNPDTEIASDHYPIVGVFEI